MGKVIMKVVAHCAITKDKDFNEIYHFQFPLFSIHQILQKLSSIEFEFLLFILLLFIEVLFQAASMLFEESFHIYLCLSNLYPGFCDFNEKIWSFKTRISSNFGIKQISRGYLSKKRLKH